MADVNGEARVVYWSKEKPDEKQSMVFFPGLSKEGNQKPGAKLNGQKTQHNKLTPMMATSFPADFPMGHDTSARYQVMHEVIESKSASLKDLCPEDKRRIANLIKELARVSEEKEVTEERLKAEQESFEKKIRQLEERNELIVTEREALQQQYRECQELLSLYQRYLSEQQEKLKLSAEPILKVLNSKQQVSHEKSPHQPKSLAHDGSYLGIPRPEVYNGSRVSFPESGFSVSTTFPHCRINPVNRVIHKSNYHEDCLQVENGIMRRCNNMAPSMHTEPYNPRMTCNINLPVGDYQNTFPHPVSHCCIYKQQRNAEDSQNSNQVDPIPQRCSAPFLEPDAFIRPPEISLVNDRVKSKPQEMSPAKQLTEERKHRLLLQKMELEIEKERLQQLLAEQEAKLLQKQQQLSQSWLDSNRGQVALDSEELIMNEALMNQTRMTPTMNSTSSGQRTPISSKIFKKQHGSNSTEKKVIRFSADSEEEALWAHRKNEVFTTEKGSRKDAATSPVMKGSRKELITTATSPIQNSSLRYESSLLELVEAVTPISASGPRSHCRDPCVLSDRIHIPQIGSHRMPVKQPAAAVSRRSEPEDELEEDQILGEIFFI